MKNSNDMIYQLYSVKDSLAGNFGNIIVCENDLVAKRWFESNSSKSEFAKDLELYHLGEYHVATGHIVPAEPEFLISGVMCIGVKELKNE